MLIIPFADWLDEQERKRRPQIFLWEWLAAFVLMLPFWAVILLEIRGWLWSLAGTLVLSSLYASVFVYLRLLRLARCRKCRSPLAITQEVIGRRYVRQAEKCVEIERGGEEWYGHYLDLYARPLRVEIVKCRCRRCHWVWEERRETPDYDYKLVRTIDLKD